VGVAGRLDQGLWINEADLVHGVSPLPWDDSRTTYVESLKANEYPQSLNTLHCVRPIV
jgi:hypothetical protein